MPKVYIYIYIWDCLAWYVGSTNATYSVVLVRSRAREPAAAAASEPVCEYSNGSLFLRLRSLPRIVFHA